MPRAGTGTENFGLANFSRRGLGKGGDELRCCFAAATAGAKGCRRLKATQRHDIGLPFQYDSMTTASIDVKLIEKIVGTGDTRWKD